jgi:simple sugar transport system ATP-binding protein
VAIARAVHFGARVLILDEPTSALGVKQAGVVLRRVAQAREKGLGVVFITHNPHHAYPVGDRFVVLHRGRLLGDYAKAEITREELVRLMAGGAELDALGHELERIAGVDASDMGAGREAAAPAGLEPESVPEPPPRPAPVRETSDEPRADPPPAAPLDENS